MAQAFIMKVETYTNAELLKRLRAIVAETNQKQVAGEIGISRPYLNQVLSETRTVSPRIAEWLLKFPVESVYRKAS